MERSFGDVLDMVDGMDVHTPTQAENTVATLQQAAGAGLPVLIPGAWEMRAGRPGTRPNSADAAAMTPDGRASVLAPRERLEREREGGGAPSQRTAARNTILSRFWRTLSGRPPR